LLELGNGKEEVIDEGREDLRFESGLEEEELKDGVK